MLRVGSCLPPYQKFWLRAWSQCSRKRLPTLSIRYIKSDKVRQTNFSEFLDDFLMKKARTKPFQFFTGLCSALLDSMIAAFCTYFNEYSIRDV